MGDSDDDGHRRSSRDKFVRERSDYGDRGRARDYEDRRHQRGDYGNGSSLKRSARHDDYNPPKRSRLDSITDTYDPVLKPAEEESSPVMKTFKKFLATQDDSITDEEAIAKYSEYKQEFKRQELLKFFNVHKDEEWFRLKYHPEESCKRKSEQKENVEKRLEVFNWINDSGLLKEININYDSAAEIIRIMDTLVVKLESGSDEDVAALQNENIEDESVQELKKSTPKDAKKDDGKSEMDISERSDAALSEADEAKKSDEDKTEENEVRQKRKMLLHKTSSIFLRNVAPTITIHDIETVCKRFPGFLRVGLAEPLPERKFNRRGWVTFRRDVNIKEICWSLNNVSIRDCDLGAIINRDIARRVRSVNGITAHKQVAQNDLRQAAKLVVIYDKKFNLFQSDDLDNNQKNFPNDFLLRSTNPLLKNVTDFIIEEASAEEEELLGISSYVPEEEKKVLFNCDPDLMTKLDRIIIYLRIVHSIDFYNHGEYPSEDYMPNRCGMMHVRGAAPVASQHSADENGNVLVAQKFINDFIAGFNSRLEANLMCDIVLSEKDLETFGKKDPEKEVESFIAANCIEISTDKWLCPVSGKKFKGPEFIRKHLMTKHQEKLDEVKQEAEFFNNFVADPKRPQAADIKASTSTCGSSTQSMSREERRERDGYDMDRPSVNRGNNYNDRNRGYNAGRYPYGCRSYEKGPSRYGDPAMGRRDPREPIVYKDLDAPEDIF